MTKLTGAALDRAVAHAMGLKSVHNCEKWGTSMNEEDEAFNEMEKQSMWRKRAVQAAISTNPYRNQVIEEVAKEVEKLTGFGKDTIDSLAVYIREMKK